MLGAFEDDPIHLCAMLHSPLSETLMGSDSGGEEAKATRPSGSSEVARVGGGSASPFRSVPSGRAQRPQPEREVPPYTGESSSVSASGGGDGSQPERLIARDSVNSAVNPDYPLGEYPHSSDRLDDMETGRLEAFIESLGSGPEVACP